MNISTTANQVFLFELQAPFERIEFQFLPQELNWDRTPNWVRVPITGRNNSRKHLTGGEDKLSFSLDFNSYFEENKNDCISKLSFLNSLTIMDGFAGAPRNVKLAWGTSDLFRNKTWVVTRVAGKMQDFHSGFGWNPMQLNVDVELELDPTESTALRDVRMFDLTNRATNIRSINDFINPNIA